jgi:hypothetical protein
MHVCLRHGCCRHMMPRCLCENCWTAHTACHFAVEVCHHHVPSTIWCDDCVREVTVRGLEDILDSPLEDITGPSTSRGQTTEHATVGSSASEENDGISDSDDNMSEASTVIPDDRRTENNLAGVYTDEWHTFWVHERHLHPNWQHHVDAITGFLPSLKLFQKWRIYTFTVRPPL